MRSNWLRILDTLPVFCFASVFIALKGKFF